MEQNTVGRQTDLLSDYLSHSDLQLIVDAAHLIQSANCHLKLTLGPAKMAYVSAAKKMYADRRARVKLFDTSLFGEAAWDILLDLYVNNSVGKAVSVSSACVGSSVPPTTALRRIVEMEAVGLLHRTQDPQDGRRSFIRLTSQAIIAMETYLSIVTTG